MYITGISKYSSINFDNEWYNDFEVERNYQQKFQLGDRIVCQFIGVPDDSISNNMVLANCLTCTNQNVTIDYEVETGEDEVIGVMDLTGLITEPGVYVLSLVNELYDPSDPDSQEYALYSLFYVYKKGDQELNNSIKLSYTNERNNFDTIFLVPDSWVQIEFDFRFEGAFIRSNEQYLNETNSFHDQGWYNRQTSSFALTSRVLTIGSTSGCPGWVGEKVNFIFSLSDVMINDVGYVRSEGAQVEVSPIGVKYPMSVYQIAVEKKKNKYEVLVPDYIDVPDETRILQLRITVYNLGTQGYFRFLLDGEDNDIENIVRFSSTTITPILGQIQGQFYCNTIYYNGYNLIYPRATTGQSFDLTLEFSRRISNIKLRCLTSNEYVNINQVLSAGSEIREVYNRTCQRIYNN